MSQFFTPPPAPTITLPVVLERVKIAMLQRDQNGHPSCTHIGSSDVIPMAQAAVAAGIQIPHNLREDPARPRQFPVVPVAHLWKALNQAVEARQAAMPQPVNPLEGIISSAAPAQPVPPQPPVAPVPVPTADPLEAYRASVTAVPDPLAPQPSPLPVAEAMGLVAPPAPPQADPLTEMGLNAPPPGAAIAPQPTGGPVPVPTRTPDQLPPTAEQIDAQAQANQPPQVVPQIPVVDHSVQPGFDPLDFIQDQGDGVKPPYEAIASEPGETPAQVPVGPPSRYALMNTRQIQQEFVRRGQMYDSNADKPALIQQLDAMDRGQG